MDDLDANGIPLMLPERAAMYRAVTLEGIAQRYHCTPMEAAQMDASILKHMAYLDAYQSVQGEAHSEHGAGEVW